MNRPAPLRRCLRAGLVPLRLMTAALAISAGISSPAFAALPFDPEWTLEASDASGLLLHWSNARPAKPDADAARSLALALPPGYSAQAALESAGASGAVVTLSPPSRYRDLLISALTLSASGPGNPFPAQARIRIAFHRDSKTPATRAAFAPSESAPAERHLQGWIANYAQSRGFRSTPAAGLAKAAADGPSASASLPRNRLLIKTRNETIQTLAYHDLREAGVPLTHIDPRHMRLYSDGVEVPLYIQGEGDGRWDPNDYLEFIGKRAAGRNTYHSFYTSRAVFILTWDGGRLGLRAPAVPVASRTGGLIPTFPENAKAALPFRTREHIEEDMEILRIGSTSAEEIVDLGPLVRETELTDFWVWKRLGAEKDIAEIPFNLAFTPALTAKGGGAPTGGSGAMRITINLKGVTNNPNANPDHHLKFLLNGTDISLVGGLANDAVWEGQETYTWVSQALDPSALNAGKNILTIQKVNDLKTSDGQAVEVQDAYLNFIEIDFPSTYGVVDDKLAFANTFADSTGLELFTLTGFTSPDISLWDRQGRKLTNFRMAPGSKGYDLTFLDTLAGRSDYIACAAAERETPEVQLDTLADLTATDQGADYLVVTEREMLGPGLDSLLEFRSKQGLRTRVVLASHIYQAFGDGSMDPAAIRRFVAYAYRSWERPAPAYLLLVGDASQGFEKLGSGRGRNIVPFHPVNIQGWGMAADDEYFGKVSGDDGLSDVAVGRLPAENREQLSGMVHKILLRETARPEGHWSNKTLLISGFEPGFTAQNYVLQGIASGNDRQYSRIDLHTDSPHYRSASQRANFFDQLDSGFNLVSFVGHGGGAVWSDAGVLTLKAIDENRLKGPYPIGLVSSVTCLTGFFEDTDARSLGEELLRIRNGGAAAFYGAAGYISSVAGEALSAEILKAATGNGFATTGEIINQAETMVKLRTGDAFLPILAEFNLLGDPASGLRFPDRKGTLKLDPQVLAGGARIEAEGSDLSIQAGDAAATILLGDSIESNLDAKVTANAVSVQRNFPVKPVGVQNGKVLVHYWNDKESHILSAPFSSLDWLLDSIAIEPAEAAPGDSVRIRAKLNTAYAKTAFSGGVASYVVGGDRAPLFPGDNQSGLKSDDGVHLESVSKVLLEIPSEDLTGPRAYVAFRLSVQILDSKGEPTQSIPNLSSRTYSLALSDLPRLELPAQAMHLPTQTKLGLWVVFHNKGVGEADGLKLSLTQDAEGPAPVIDTVTYQGKVPKGGMDSVFFALADSMLQGKRLRATLIPSRPGDLAVAGGSQDTLFRLDTRLLSKSTDTLALDTLGTFATLPRSGSKPVRIFADRILVNALPSHLAPAQGSLPVTAYRIRVTDFAEGGLILGRPEPFPAPEAGAAPKTGAAPKAGAAADAAPALPAWHYRDTDGGTWVKLDTVASASARLAAAFRGGLYAWLLNADVTSPLIQLSSRGQALLQDDYVPLNTPIDVVIRDGEGVDLALHPPVLASARQNLDSTNLAQENTGSFPTLARINFLPSHKNDRDSITITARDISGNVAERTLAYRLGDDLRIRDLGSYPNPFADTATFVYSLTDYCDRVDLKVYSRAGRMVRTLEQRNVVGYQEMVWDGRTGSGAEIANGLYFLKVTAKAGGKETSKIFKLFKKQRK